MQFACSIYGLRAAGGPIRYVGVTKRQLKDRLKGHLFKARRGERTHKANWIRACLARGETIEIVLLRLVPFCAWEFWETHFIAALPDLTNGNAGGRGQLNPTAETRKRLRDSHLGQKPTDTWRRMMSEFMKGNKFGLGKKPSAETRAKLSAAFKGKCGRYERTAEWRAKKSEQLKGRPGPNRGRRWSDVSKQKNAEAHRGKKMPPWSPERRAKFMATLAAKKAATI